MLTRDLYVLPEGAAQLQKPAEKSAEKLKNTGSPSSEQPIP